MISFSFDSQYLLATGDQGKIFIWDCQKGEIFKANQFNGNIIHMSFLKKQFHTLLLCENLNKELIIIILNIQTQLKQKFENNFSGNFKSIKISPFGNYLALRQEKQIQLYQFDFENQKFNQQILIVDFRYYSKPVISFNSDETQIIVGGNSSEYIQCFETKSCKLIYEIKIESSMIENIFTFDEKQVFISFIDCLYRITLNELHQICVIDSLFFKSEIQNAFLMKNEYIIILTSDKMLRKLKNCNQKSILNHCFFEKILYQPPIILDNELVYTIESESDYLKAYDLKTKKKKFEKVVDGWINVYISKDEQLFAFKQNGNIKLLRFEDLDNFKKIKIFESHTKIISQVEVSEDHKYLVTICDDRIIKLWNIINLQNPIILFVQYNKQYPLMTIISHDSSYFSWCSKKRIIIQKIEKCKTILKRYFKLQNDRGRIKEIDLITQNDKQFLIIVTSKQLLLKDLETDETNIILELEFAYNFQFCDNYKVCAYTDSDCKNIRIIKNPFESAKSSHEIKIPHEGNFSISLQKDGEYLVTGGRSDCAVRIWCMKKYTQLLQLFLGDQVTNVCFSPDGFHLVAGTDQGAVCLFISNLSKDKLKKKYFKLVESLGEDHKIGCLKVFSQQPLLQMQNCQDSNLTINQQDQSLTQDQSLQVLFEQKQQNVK